MRPTLRLVAVTGLLVVGACSSSSSSSGGAVTTVPQSLAATPSTAAAIGTKPVVTVPAGAPPTQLQVSDLVPGTGQAAKAGDMLTVQYVGVSYTNKKQFDASWDRPGQPFVFPLGQSQVIAGWDQGLVGMKVGGRRQLVIPPDLGYGAQGPAGSGIAPNDTLIFVIDLLKIG